ncbi:hypothetical protein COT27_01450 [Candidatus Kuenenbacteria bacterium CG08_land_8_20_14_0_20_37_23]|uniref:Uncharacterized protein n=2 Tax=Candidatus Kueneniibacteriota TaxID=1752740 RepID=A0A2M6XT48_9BACT|nr:MAG: hypothetical protein AUJ29_00610 [Candidatus Kuenenbacteria bacterium CG1_02_38_13]PIU10761.1 MAG: hypothetical protein COT27_01450 [Candidatus Kuenenbacteria bacterium CG08_land_8_20_14_0_20_37_23]
MTLRKYLISMILATFFCLIAWLEVIFFVNPENTDTLGFILFYASLFLTLWGIFSLIGFVVRYIFIKQDFAYAQVKAAFRQGFFFSILLNSSLFLQSQKLLVWWNTLLLVGLLTAIEFFFINFHSERANNGK